MTTPEEPRSPGWRLRRGVAVHPRPDGLLQVGTDPGRRLLLPPHSAARVLLRSHGREVLEPHDPAEHELVLRLVRRGLVVDEVEDARRARARRETLVRVVGPAPWQAQMRSLLQDEGLSTEDAAVEEADATVLLSAGEPDRGRLDDLAHRGDPLLLLAAVDARVRLGPFVLPGSTACLRCVDAHLADRDPVLRSAPAPRSGGAEVARRLLQHALRRAGAEVVAWAEGRRPRTWSTTTWIDEDLVEESEAWRRHPRCGCSWGDLLVSG